MKRILLATACLLVAAPLCRGETLFVEAETFENLGGWSLDTAFTQIVGSPYLLAHGLGKPCADATTTVDVPAAGKYRVWVRTKDWVAHWKAPGTPGRFQVLVDGKPLATEFGTVGADWHWQPGGELELPVGKVKLALHDLTGFDGRCDAILLSSDAGFQPPTGKDLAAARKKWLGLPDQPEVAGEYDLVVVGGGYAGIATAVSAARQSLKVALVQDRFVLGGNGSSEVRVWAQGGTLRGKYPHLGEIVEEFADHAPDSPAAAEHFADERKEAVVRREKNISLFLGHFAQAAETDAEGKITSVTALEVRTGRERVFRGKLFCDCTGHGVVGALAGAAYRIEPQGRMGMSNMWYWQQEAEPQSWPATPWALDLEVGDFPNTVKSRSKIGGIPFQKGEWFWESGFNKDPINELELIRDWNLRAVFGAFTALKHGAEKDKHTHADLKWVAFVGGPRESRLLDGDVILSREDIISGREFPDGCVPTTWDIDLHYPKEQFAKKYTENPFISRAEFGAGVDRKNGYPVPYRCFYSKNVQNLFMAGRCISVTHEALGTTRVMKTCGMMGEVVGKAASICVKNDCSPRDVQDKYLSELFELLELPGKARRLTVDAPIMIPKDIPELAGPLGPPSGLDPKKLAGLVIDDRDAKKTGSWTEGTGLKGYVGYGYLYAGPSDTAAVQFEMKPDSSGRFEIRISYGQHENRGTQVPVTVKTAAGEKVTTIDMRKAPPLENGFISVGTYDLNQGETVTVTIAAKNAGGFVHADAMQVLPAK
jgi:hypothetical protein